MKQSVAQYKPGSGGKDSKTGEFHYRCVIDSIQVTASSIKTKKDLIDKINKTQPLDGAGMLHLILQDLSMKSFFDKPKSKLGAPPPSLSAEEWSIENVMVIITDDQWDTKGLKNERGTPIDEAEIIKVINFILVSTHRFQNTTSSFDKVYGASGQLILTDAMKSDNFLLHKLSKSTNRASLFTPGKTNFESQTNQY